MLRSVLDPDAIYRNLRRVVWSCAEYIGVRNGLAVELTKVKRTIPASAPTLLLAWQIAERAAVSGRYDD